MSPSLPQPVAPRPAEPRLHLLPSSGERSALLSLQNAWLVPVGAMLLGALIRAMFVFSSDFPLNDGGMFYVMIGDLQQADFRLPHVTSYNGGDIPYAYPPLGLYAAAFLSEAFGVAPADAMRFLPLLVNTLTIGAFFLLARSVLKSPSAQAAATFSFALLPRGFMWMIMGGGLTRSVALFFTVLALQQLQAAYTRGDGRSIALAALFGGLTLLSHIEASWMLFCGALVLLFRFGRNRTGLARSLLAASGAALVAAPWLVTVIARHGIDMLLDAGGSRPLLSAAPLTMALQLNFTNEPLVPLLSLVALLGVLICVSRREWFLPAWLAVAALSASWVLATSALLPIALLAGVGIADGLLPALQRLGSRQHTLQRGDLSPLATGVLVFLLCYSMLAALVVAPGTLAALPQDERGAMRWVAANTPESSRFLVISGDQWSWDKSSEWFPALAQRVSVATPQGQEWMPHSAFDRRLEAHRKAQECALEEASCLTLWSAETGIDYTHVFISKRVAPRTEALGYDDCCPVLRASLIDHSAYTLVYDSPGASIFALTTAP